jgi:hypothetical protein
VGHESRWTWEKFFLDMIVLDMIVLDMIVLGIAQDMAEI